MIPFVIVLQIITNDLYVLIPPFFSGLAVIYFSRGQSISGKQMGWRAGLVNGLSLIYGTIVFLFETSYIWLDEAPILLTIAALVLTPIVSGLFVLMYGVIGAFGGLVGVWALKNINNGVFLSS